MYDREPPLNSTSPRRSARWRIRPAGPFSRGSSRGEASVLELAEPFDMSQPAISKHLKVLERAGLIARGRDAQRRPCRLEPRRLKQAADWLGTYRQFWEAELRTDWTTTFSELQTKEKTRDVNKTRNHRRTR